SKENTVSFHPFLDESFAALLPNPQPAVHFVAALLFALNDDNKPVGPPQTIHRRNLWFLFVPFGKSR
ncbi:hypothetical protein OBK00_01480, partial [Empedobacter falsenii]